MGGQEVDVEAVAAPHPDLIVGVYSFRDQATYDRLSGIAPTLAQTDEYADGASPWQEQALLTGRALGRDDEVQELVDDVEGRFADVAQQHPEFAGRSVAVDFAGVGGSAHHLFGTPIRCSPGSTRSPRTGRCTSGVLRRSDGRPRLRQPALAAVAARPRRSRPRPQAADRNPATVVEQPAA